MSHGEYTSELDLWSMGCVFGELLQRVPYLGKSSTPMLQVSAALWYYQKAHTYMYQIIHTHASSERLSWYQQKAHVGQFIHQYIKPSTPMLRVSAALAV